MMVNYRSIWLVLLVVLLLATLITLGKVSPMMTMVIILLTLVPLVTLLPREHLLVATVFILPQIGRASCRERV